MAHLEDGKTVSRIFLENFLSKRDLSPYYEKVTNTLSQKVIYEQPVSSAGKGCTYIIKDVPNYLQPDIPFANSILGIKRIVTYPGFIIDLKKYKDIEEYLRTHFGKASRSKLRRYQNRLELCFDISYKVFYGEIQKAEYDYLFTCLKTLLERRFVQKSEANYELQYWEDFHKIMFPLIQQKRAFLYVIYDGDKPIDITLNVVYDKIVFSNISAYDIDYAAFSLGAIDMIKHVEWCFDNGFETIDLLKGYHYYKKRWINGTYDYERHIVYDTTSLPTVLKANVMAFRVSLFYRIYKVFKKWHWDALYHKFKTFTVRKHRKNEPWHNKREVVKDNPFTHLPHEVEPIDIRKEEFAFLRESAYQFAYSNAEHINDILFYRKTDTPGSYLAVGKKKHLEMTINTPLQPVTNS